MKYLFLTIFFLASFAVIACGQIVFPSPNQMEMQKGYLTLRKKISIYAEDTTTFYLSLFRTEVLHNASVKWTKKASKAEIRWMIRFFASSRRLSDKYQSATNGDSRL